ncbi:MAG: hypothetical protein CL755_02410 [Chloroflexi bacterium]|nr:hypothetical protein [Chloroflexota bacterium]MCH2538076.1 hypothetical protein [Dehalococcoidia bacterium]MEE2928692.1 hypothetical protein [Chloroflexota bacterium]HIM47356.1 hypothetical protein [Dehalococcoidia bacterium]
MNLDDLSVGLNVLLDTGDLAEVLSINDGEQTVRICYLDAMGQPELVGSEVWLSVDEVIAIDMGSHSEGRT